jgi:O-antigen ligase
MPRRVKLAVWLAFGLHGIFILSARYRLSYDAYNHMFFGDHYRLDWWSLWEPRWYTGFEVTSYPPLTHQLIGLLGHLMGVDAAFGLLLWAVLSLFPLGVYAFCRIFTGKTVAGYAALGAALLPSIYQAAHTFGQLPTLAGTLCALLAMAALNDYLLKGERLSLACAVALTGVVMAAHHATLLFLPWALGAVLLHILLNHKMDRFTLLARLALFGGLAAAIGLLVIWPFWVWGRSQTMQTPIDHPSRHNFFTDPFAPVAFFLPAYGALIPLIPFALWLGAHRKTFGLWAAFVILFVLGLGGTTPLPRWIFGAGWEWLTYDRFALWASLLLLPFSGIGMVLARRRFRPWLLRRFPRLRQAFESLSPAKTRRGLGLFLYYALCLTALVSGLLPTLLPTQPAQVNMQPIVDFLAKDDRSKWRYLTFGLGDQLAYLSRLTPATTIDGSYHTARGLPELRASGLGQVDTAYWLPDGLSRLDPILQKSGEQGVRWGFLNRIDYIPILRRNGWLQRGFLKNGVQVWENPKAVLPPPVQPPPEDPLAVFSWGVLPISALLLALALGSLRLRPRAAQQTLLNLHFIIIGLLPLALSLWYYRILVPVEQPKVYFTYDSLLFYLSDGLALAAVGCWALAMVGAGPASQRPFNPQTALRSPASWLLGLCLLASLSCLWSQDRLVTLYFSLHLWLAFGLFLSVQDRPDAWRAFALGSVAALLLQAGLGIAQFAAQNTALLSLPGLNWPGPLRPADHAASVVQLADGYRWLRAYGTLPHPNILGGWLVVFLAGLAALYLLNTRHRLGLLALSGLGLAALLLTFSRSAWLALGLFALILIVHWRRFERRRLLALGLVGLLGVGLVSMPYRELIFTRSGAAQQVRTEDFSSKARLFLLEQSLQFIREKPLGGLGAGASVLELARRAPYGYIVEPVHNVLLLVSSELGLPGGLLALGLAFSVVWSALRARRPEQILFTALVLGLGLIAVFDHYLWSLAPGRLLAALALGLMAGQGEERGVFL